MAHFVHADGAVGDGAPLLGDQAAVAAALLDAYEVTGERRWLRRAREPHALGARALLRAPDGRLHGPRWPCPARAPACSRSRCRRSTRTRPMAEVLLRLEAYTGEPRLREQALEILAAWAPHYEQYGVAAAPRTARRCCAIWSGPTRSSSSDAAATTRRGGCTPPRSPRRARCAPSSGSTPPTPLDAERLREAGLPDEPSAAAYVCRGRTCSLFRP